MAQLPPLEKKLARTPVRELSLNEGIFAMSMQNTNCRHKLYHITILGQYIVMGYVYYCANNGLPILPILIYLYWHNIGESILVQNRKQRLVNIVTNIGAI